jgi:hypothetical protein
MAIVPVKVGSIRALGSTVLVEEMNFTGRTLSSGIILPNDNGKSSGIRPRWGRVYAIGPEHRDVQVGQWICVAHGRWTRGLDLEEASGEKKTIRKVDPKDILLVSNEQPDDATMSDAVLVADHSR